MQCISTIDAAALNLHNVYFLESSADKAIVKTVVHKGSSTFILSMTNVIFVENKLRACLPSQCGIVLLSVRNTQINVSFKNTRFIGNLAKQGSCICLDSSQSTLQIVTLDTCIFTENIGNGGTVYVAGRVALTCKHSIFNSNRGQYCLLALDLNNSTIFLKNTTFVNNLCTALTVYYIGTSRLIIYDSAFVRNKNI